jgi:transposase
LLEQFAVDARRSPNRIGHVEIIANDADERLQGLQTMIGAIEKRIIRQHRASEESKRVATIPGIGVLGASAIAATVTDPSAFRSGRGFAAWVRAGAPTRFDWRQTKTWADFEAG